MTESLLKEPECASECPLAKDLKNRVEELEMKLNSLTPGLPPIPENQETQKKKVSKVITADNVKFLK